MHHHPFVYRETTRGRKTSTNKPCYRVPSTKPKNVVCVACKRKFNVSDLTKLTMIRPTQKGIYVPLLMDCGHPICSRCVKVEKIKSCSLCENGIATEGASNQESLLPLNLYALGLLASSFNHPLENDDEDFLFCHRQSAQMRQISKLGCCHECGNQANVSCLQCTILFCYRCFSKIHGKALNFHTQVPVYEGDPNTPAAILNRCSPKCNETLNYFCNDCNVACCSNCTLCLHKMHEYMSLSEKNETLLPEFNEICTNIEETLLRVQQTKEKIESVLTSTNSNNLENITVVEKEISQHFAYLHGVLQNTEAELIKQLYEQRVSLKNNLEDLNTQLKSQESRLNMTLQMAAYAKQSFQNVDIQNAIEILKDLTDLPCHLMYKDAGQNKKATFTYDNSVIETIRNHCSIKVSPVSLYSLVRTDELPENYIVSPVKKQSLEKIYEELSLISLPKKPDSGSTTMSIKSEDIEAGDEKKKDSTQNDSISECKIEVVYVIDPSFFFVRKVISKSEFEELEKDLTRYGNDRQGAESPIKLKPDDRCIVREMKADGKWFRGRVTAVIQIEDGTLYNIFYLDYGCEEYNIPASRIRNIAPDFLELPPQAIRCCLHGLMPKKNFGWSNASTNDFIKLTSGTDCSMFIIKSTPDMLYVDLCVDLKNNMGPQSVCNTMKVMDYARLDNCSKTTRARVSQQTYVYEKEELPLNKFPIQVIITCFESPDKIYVRKLEQQNRFLKLDLDLQEYYKGDNSSKIVQSPRKGLPCALQNSDLTWSRGEILEVIDGKVAVFCVDSGNTKVVDCDELRSIPDEYTMLKTQAIRISLMYIMPESNGQWKTESYLALLKLFEHAKCVTITSRRKIEDGYTACICIDDVDVSRQLKTAGVVNTLQTRRVKDKSLNKDLVSSFKNMRASKYAEKLESLLKDLSYDDEIQEEEKKPVEKNETTKDLFKVEVRVQRVVTPDCIYVAQMEHKESNTKMITAMQRFYDNFKSESRDNWSVGALCAVYSAKDKAYFRAKILKINSPTEVLVYFYDMGIEETVTMQDIQILHMKFVKEPAYCFNVKLAGILPCGGSSVWPSFSCTTLCDIIQENAYCKYYITRPAQEKEYSDPIPVELWVRQTKIPGPLAPTEIEINSVNRMLVEKGVALPIKNYFAKSDSILAAEFKLQLEGNYQFMLPEEIEEVKWFNKWRTTDLKDIEEEIETLSFEGDLSCLNASSLSLNSKNQIYDSTNRKSAAVKLTDWLPPVEITEEVFHAVPTYVDNKCTVYLHSKKYNADILNYIESELQIHYKKVKVDKNKVWKEGDLCIAKYHFNNKWYRGRIIKDLGNIVKVNFVDYGNEEECEKEHVSHQIRLGHIPIQCTKCIISGLKPKSLNEKWMLHDLDRIHALLVDHECKVSVLQRRPTHLIISITLLRPWKCDLLMYLANHMDMNIKIEHKEWNNEENYESEDLQSNSTSRDVIIEKTITDEETCTVNVSREFLSDTYMEETFNENVISGNFADVELSKLESPDESIRQSDFENMSWMETITLDNQLHACSTPQPQSDEETDFFNVYKELIIPQETQYIELVLCCNRDPITSFAQLAENNDDMFPNMFNNYYLQYMTIMSDLQTSAFDQPLIESFEKNTPCVTKFSDNMWYRCIITNSERIPDSQCVQITLYYVDFGNYEDKTLKLFSIDHNLRVPKEDWLELPPMAIKCTFWGLHFVSKDITLLASKLDEIYNQTVVARIKKINSGNSIMAEIYKDKTCKELFYDDLIKEGLYQFENPEEDCNSINTTTNDMIGII